MVKSRWLFPLLLALYEMAAYLSNDAYLPALPLIAKDLMSTQQLAASTLSMWFMGSALTPLFLGTLCDYMGRRKILLIGGLIFLASTVCCALASEIHVLLILRAIQGATIASIVIAGYATIHELFDREQAIHTLAVMNSITVLAPSFGPLLGAIFLYFIDWRWIFGILAIWAGLAITGLFFAMPETSTRLNQKLPTQKVSMKETFKETLISYKNILSNRSFMLYALTGRFLFAGMIAWITLAPFLLMDYFHFTRVQFGIAQAVIFGSFILSTRSVKKLMQHFQLNTIIGAGIGLAVISGVCAFASALLWSGIAYSIIAPMMLFAGGSGLAFAILERLAIESSPESMGAKMALCFCLTCIAATFGSILSSVFYAGSFYSQAVLLLICSLLALTLQTLNTRAHSTQNG